MWYWWVGAACVWLLSAGCIVATIVDLRRGRCGPFGPKRVDFWGGIVFHGTTAILALWSLAKALTTPT